MGKIVQRLKVVGDKGEARVKVLFDSGAGSSLIRQGLAEKLCSSFQPLHQPSYFKGVNGQKALESAATCTLELELKGKLLVGLFYVVSGMPRDILLGVDFMQRWDIRLYPKREEYSVGVDPQAIEIA